VDDVLIMSKENLQEWRDTVFIINVFCKSSSLMINPTKTMVHFEGLLDTEILPFKDFLPYNFSDLSIGFHYLGYYLKTRSHRAAYWEWLVNKILKKITLWCYRWLSLGGRYILVKIVLEGQLVY
jgi:hypothetical protein